MSKHNSRDTLFIRVAIPTPLRRLFDYLPPLDTDAHAAPPIPGARIKVPFGHRQVIGIVIALCTESSVPPEKLKPALQILDDESVFPDALFDALQWAASYYQHPTGEVFATALPTLLRQGEQLTASTALWSVTDNTADAAEQLQRAPRQKALFDLVKVDGPITTTSIKEQGFDQTLIKQLETKGLIRSFTQSDRASSFTYTSNNTQQDFHLNDNQANALAQLQQNQGFNCLLLDGVTGSGKTEVYMQAMEQQLATGKQCLLLVPEIGLTPQVVARFEHRFDCPIVLLHSGLSNRERLLAWRQARQGQAGIIIGTRSAVFTPMARPGLIVIDEEHDSSFKQQDGFRYSARDFAIKRAQQEDIAIILGSATPSLESLSNALDSKYQHAKLNERAGTAKAASMQIIDIEREFLDHGFSEAMLVKIEKHLAAQNQVLVFINRRGFAPVLQCQDCAWIAECENCIAQFTVHSKPAGLRCHHCGVAQRLPRQCPQCHSSHLETLGLGTQKLELFLEKKFPQVPVMRIDRDSMRAKSSFDSMLNEVGKGEPCILVGTQMLAKGHHFTDVTLVAILDADLGLFSADFRGQEHMAQTIVQVAGRAGRGAKAGEVSIQSRHSGHPTLQSLVSMSYEQFAGQLLQEREEGQMPPFSHLALLQVESSNQRIGANFAETIFQSATALAKAPVALIGPMPAPMEKRAGRYRTHLLFKSTQRSQLQAFLAQLSMTVESLKLPKQTRWSLDVDPLELI